jgi:hypothetical protein
VRLIMAALIERGSTNEDVREGVARIMDVMREAIARGMRVLPIPPHRIEGIATLTLETLAGAFLDHYANADLALFEHRLKVVRKMVALMLEYEMKAAVAR